MGFYLLEELRARWDDAPYDELVTAAGAATPFAAIFDMEDPAFFAPEDPEAAVADYLRRTGQAGAAGGLSRGEKVRCQLEGLALLYWRTIEELRSATGVEPDGICLVGGGCRNRVFCQLVADATGLPVAAGPVEATAIGNLGLQMVATGELGQPAEVRALAVRSFPPDRYEPRPGGGWNEAYERYGRIVAARRTG
jgi:rhamnulokinase